MNFTQWAAYVGACSGLASLIWNIYSRVTTGPKLQLTAYVGKVKMPPPPNNPPYLRISVRNVGTQPTTITRVSFFRYRSLWQRIQYRPLSPAGVLMKFSGPPLPHRLDVGEEWAATTEQDANLDAWVRSGLWCAVHHPLATRPVQVKIYRWRAQDKREAANPF
jgi:hypothetical protein